MKKRQVVLKRNDSSRNSVNSSLTVRTVRYAECQKNHAASVGGYAVDGCREFMPCGGEGTDDALTCAACGCHRNFHRRELVKGLSPKEMTGEEPKALKRTTEKDEA